MFRSAQDTGTNPHEPDSDGDGFYDDRLELAAGSDPNDVADVPTPVADFDFAAGDGGFTDTPSGTSPVRAVYNEAEGAWWFPGDDSGPSEIYLTSPEITLPATGAVDLVFDHRYSLERWWAGHS